MVYYNEHDPFAAQWLRNLMEARWLPRGDVDERDIQDVAPVDLVGYRQCHFFAGIGGWPYALRLSGWPDEEPVWTGSCPCQPFSVTGYRLGTTDARHLWPDFFRLIAECRPPVVFGEQVASKAGRGWLAGVRADLERVGYAVGAADLPAASVCAPHIRQRLWWVADADGEQSAPKRVDGPPALSRPFVADVDGAGADGGLADADGGHSSDRPLQRGRRHDEQPKDEALQRTGRREEGAATGRTDASCWSDYVLVHCADGKTRRLEPGCEPLADGFSGRVGRLRAYGNAIVPQVAAEFIKSYLKAVDFS